MLPSRCASSSISVSPAASWRHVPVSMSLFPLFPDPPCHHALLPLSQPGLVVWGAQGASAIPSPPCLPQASSRHPAVGSQDPVSAGVGGRAGPDGKVPATLGLWGPVWLRNQASPTHTHSIVSLLIGANCPLPSAAGTSVHISAGALDGPAPSPPPPSRGALWPQMCPFL